MGFRFKIGTLGFNIELIERHFQGGELERVHDPTKPNFPLDSRSSGTSLQRLCLDRKKWCPVLCAVARTLQPLDLSVHLSHNEYERTSQEGGNLTAGVHPNQRTISMLSNVEKRKRGCRKRSIRPHPVTTKQQRNSATGTFVRTLFDHSNDTI